MRLRSEVVGALNLFTAQAQDLDAETLQLRRALADAATNDLPQARTILQRDALTEQSQSVLDTRVLIQHAKGIIAERHHVDMDAVFTPARCRRPQPQPPTGEPRPPFGRRLRDDVTDGTPSPLRPRDEPAGDRRASSEKRVPSEVSGIDVPLS